MFLYMSKKDHIFLDTQLSDKDMWDFNTYKAFLLV